MEYSDAIDFLFNQLPAFEVQGAGAYKPGLDTAHKLSAAFGDPHKDFLSIHVAGTNGKGSTTHMLASVLMEAGYKVGIYTSPHLYDFRERIRVNGEMIDRQSVVDFVDRYLRMSSGTRKLSKTLENSRKFSKDLEPIRLDCSPTFFELTTIMAFEYFSRQGVDIAVVETGLGGRLDTTNIITPLVSVITNVSLDHMAQLGDTVEQIAAEKAGIIKPGVPVVIGEAEGGVRKVFSDTAARKCAPIVFADDWIACRPLPPTDLAGAFQVRNIATVLTAVEILTMQYRLESITPEVVSFGLTNVKFNTHLIGRWEERDINGRHIIMDPGHNAGAWQYTAPKLNELATNGELWIVLGFSSDKDITDIMASLPASAHYVFVKSSTKRGRSATDLLQIAEKRGLSGHAFDTVAEGVDYAMSASAPGSTIFIGGSFYVLAEVPLLKAE